MLIEDSGEHSTTIGDEVNPSRNKFIISVLKSSEGNVIKPNTSSSTSAATLNVCSAISEFNFDKGEDFSILDN